VFSFLRLDLARGSGLFEPLGQRAIRHGFLKHNHSRMAESSTDSSWVFGSPSTEQCIRRKGAAARIGVPLDHYAKIEQVTGRRLLPPVVHLLCDDLCRPFDADCMAGDAPPFPGIPEQVG
jgi:hypothetical protein